MYNTYKVIVPGSYTLHRVQIECFVIGGSDVVSENNIDTNVSFICLFVFLVLLIKLETWTASTNELYTKSNKPSSKAKTKQNSVMFKVTPFSTLVNL